MIHAYAEMRRKADLTSLDLIWSQISSMFVESRATISFVRELRRPQRPVSPMPVSAVSFGVETNITYPNNIIYIHVMIQPSG